MNTLGELDFCVVDTETTGGSAGGDRIIDIAVFHVRDGIILNKFQSLINPGVPIPAWITALTGIDDSMVKNAPSFEEIAGSLKEILEKGIFTAHNVGFDYGFVQSEFLRLGLPFQRPTVCTVRFARHLYPELASRSLGFLCDHLMITIFDRHRAAGDAEATVYVLKNLIKKAQAEHGVSTWEDLELLMQMGPLLLPQGMALSELSHLPETEGEYVFKDEKGIPVFRGRSKNIRRRIRTFFRKSNQSEKSNRFREVVRFIEAIASPLQLG